MNVGMVLEHEFPPDSRVKNEAISLLKAGHQVYLLSVNYGELRKFEEIAGIKVYRIHLPREIYNKLSPLVPILPFYGWFWQPAIEKFLLGNKIDILHIHDLPLVGLGIKIGRKFNIPIVADLHENRPEIMKYYSYTRTLLGRLLINIKQWERYQEISVNLVDYLLVVTTEAKNDILKHGISKDKVCVVPNTVNLKEFLNYPIKKNIIERYRGYFVLSYLGDTSLRRGTNLLIKAVSIIRDKIKNIKLVLVGGSSDDHYLIYLTERHNLKEIVDFEGWQDFDLFPSYIKASSICFSPLIKNRHHDTTYPEKLFNYMAIGKPVIVSNCRVQQRIIEEENCGLVFESGNVHQLCKCILKLYKNNELRKKMGENGKKAVLEKYNWDVTDRDFVDFYNKIQRSKRADS